jgi:Fe-S cluster assembly protein SufD
LLKTADSPASSEAERLRALLTPFDPTLLPPELRSAALERFFSTRSGRERTGRYWRVDIEAIAPDPETIAVSNGTVRIANSSPRIVACSLTAAAASHAQLLARCFGVTDAGETKFGALARAFAQLGAFVYVPADATTAEPVEITYDVPDGASAFPYTVVLAERGARATIVERCEGGAGAFVCGVAEIVTGENADVTYGGIFTRRAAPGRDTRVDWACAELGGELDLTDVSTAILQPGIQAGVTALFFPNQTQHVDVVTTIDHAIGDSTSETIVKTAAVDAGQARYLGNIRIAPHAQGSDASLRDDALLLSEKAHVDSVPALEIGANDVKAFHGATVGALDAEQIFYMQTRGIERSAAERMIALGFFEPSIARFPTDALREQIRSALAEKLR